MEGPLCFHTIKNLLRHIMRPPEIETVKCPNLSWIQCVQMPVQHSVMSVKALLTRIGEGQSKCFL